MACGIPEICEFLSLAPHQVVGFVLQGGDADEFPQAVGLESLNPPIVCFLSVFMSVCFLGFPSLLLRKCHFPIAALRFRPNVTQIDRNLKPIISNKRSNLFLPRVARASGNCHRRIKSTAHCPPLPQPIPRASPPTRNFFISPHTRPARKSSLI